MDEGATPLVWAHRGASATAPENTLAAFRRALEAGADGVELDVHLTADGHVIVIHDATLDRTTSGRGRVADLPLSAVRSFDAGVKCSAEFLDERVPTLAEVLELVLGWPGQRRVLVELKGPFSGLARGARLAARALGLAAPAYGGLARALAALLAPRAAAVREGRVVAQSFHRPYLDELHELVPELKLLYLSPLGFLETEDLENSDLNLDGLAVKHTNLTRDKLSRLRRCHRTVLAWTVDSKRDLLSMISLKVDGLITNRPEIAVELLAAGQSETPAETVGWCHGVLDCCQHRRRD